MPAAELDIQVQLVSIQLVHINLQIMQIIFPIYIDNFILIVYIIDIKATKCY